VQSFLGATQVAWDVVFLDPPYDLGGRELVHNLEALVPRLTPDAIVVVERSARDSEPAWPHGLELDRRKDYGDTAVYYLSTAKPAE
jgi:16S rRNA (guanine966-N2)-methyltransferase